MSLQMFLENVCLILHVQIVFCAWTQLIAIDNVQNTSLACCNILSLKSVEADLNTYVTPCSRILFEKLMFPQVVKKFPRFMELSGSLLHSQEPVLCPILSPLNPIFSPYLTSQRSTVI